MEKPQNIRNIIDHFPEREEEPRVTILQGNYDWTFINDVTRTPFLAPAATLISCIPILLVYVTALLLANQVKLKEPFPS